MTCWLLSFLLVGLASWRSHAGECFPSDADLDELRAEWYCKHLRAADTGPLEGDPAYRFIYLPTFHAPRIVTVTMVSGKPVATGVVLSGRGGYDPGTVQQDTRRGLTDDEWRLLQVRLENAGMWDPSGQDGDSGLDGSQWVLEGREDGKYRLHDIWSPTSGSFPQYRKVCAYMLELAGINPDPGELY